MNYFVFVVCGAKEYIGELNFSLRFLRHFSKYPIVVLTDSSRNEIAIEHDTIIDAPTPLHYQNHQAHLYLETRLPHYVKPQQDDVYCYLDSDVIAIDSKINDVFEEFTEPVRFAADHCTIDYFSAGVMNCSCKDEFMNIEKQFHFMQSYYPEVDFENMDIANDRNELKNLFYQTKHQPFAHGFQAIKYFYHRYLSNSPEFAVQNKYFFNRTDKCWYNKASELIDFDYSYYTSQLWKKHNIRYKNNQWKNRRGKALVPESPHCNHLREHIQKFYKINIPSGWQHWNGGVFLFTQKSIDFMNHWHQFTMQEFDRGKIKTYDDQGTLAVCAWKYGVQNMKTLPVKYNFITDFGNKSVKYQSQRGFTYNNFKTIFNPVFLHVYNEWGNTEWDIWQAVTEIGKKHGIL